MTELYHTEACNGCGEDHDPENCNHGFSFNTPYGDSVELFDIEVEKELCNG